MLILMRKLSRNETNNGPNTTAWPTPCLPTPWSPPGPPSPFAAVSPRASSRHLSHNRGSRPNLPSSWTQPNLLSSLSWVESHMNWLSVVPSDRNLEWSSQSVFWSLLLPHGAENRSKKQESRSLETRELPNKHTRIMHDVCVRPWNPSAFTSGWSNILWSDSFDLELGSYISLF